MNDARTITIAPTRRIYDATSSVFFDGGLGKIVVVFS